MKFKNIKSIQISYNGRLTFNNITFFNLESLFFFEKKNNNYYLNKRKNFKSKKSFGNFSNYKNKYLNVIN